MKHFLKGLITITSIPIILIAFITCWFIDIVRDLGGCEDYSFCVKLDSIIDNWIN